MAPGEDVAGNLGPRSAGRTAIETRRPPTVLLDFAGSASSPYVSRLRRLSYGDVAIDRVTLASNPGANIGASQVTATVHLGAPFDMEWRLMAGGRLERVTVTKGRVHINDSDMPLFQRWPGSPEIILLAISRTFFDRAVAEATDGKPIRLRPVIGAEDTIVAAMGRLWHAELRAGGVGGRLYAEGMATALAAHLLRHYADEPYAARYEKGGLGAARLRRVIDFIETNFDGDIGVEALAAVAGLSGHHFAEVFKTATGRPPYAYVVETRVRRAKELLLGTDLSVAEIAVAVGFSSQSHLTVNFRRLVGTTPARFRIDNR